MPRLSSSFRAPGKVLMGSVKGWVNRGQGLQTQRAKPLHEVSGGLLLALVHVAAAVEGRARELFNGLADAGQILGDGWGGLS